jgi:hypothetical protein
MKTVKIIICLLVLCAGCQSPLQTKSEKTVLAASFGPELTYHVLRTNDLDSSRTITVQVNGEVVHPGTFTFPQGTTLLEAILEAGGFTKYSAKSHIYVKILVGTCFDMDLGETKACVLCGVVVTQMSFLRMGWWLRLVDHTTSNNYAFP